MTYKVFTTVERDSAATLTVIPQITGNYFLNIEDELIEHNSGYVLLSKDDLISLSNHLIELINKGNEERI